MATPEDQRAAVGIKMSLSSYLISAALTVLGVQVALVTFVLDKREELVFFGLVSIAGFLALAASIILGGKGMTEAYKSGFAGAWSVDSTQGQFQAQAVLALAGVCLVALSALLGTPRSESAPIASLQATISRMEKVGEASAAERRSLAEKLTRVEQELSQLRNAIDAITAKPPRKPETKR